MPAPVDIYATRHFRKFLTSVDDRPLALTLLAKNRDPREERLHRFVVFNSSLRLFVFEFRTRSRQINEWHTDE